MDASGVAAAGRVRAFLAAHPGMGPVYVMKDYTAEQLRSDLREILAFWLSRLEKAV